MASETPCRESGCTALVYCRGYCKRHYERLRTHGEIEVGQWVRRGPICSVSDCERVQRARGWCDLHYARWKLHGDPNVTKRFSRVASSKHPRAINTHGYAEIAGRLEHRLVMESILGRRLLPDENVHHKNGIRNDNHPENLELWVSSQPPGQRVEDMVAWAREILRRYDRPQITDSPEVPVEDFDHLIVE